MARKTRTSGRFYLPADDKNRTFETLEGALSLATRFAENATEDKTIYVHCVGEQGMSGRATRVGKTVLVERVR